MKVMKSHVKDGGTSSAVLGSFGTRTKRGQPLQKTARLGREDASDWASCDQAESACSTSPSLKTGKRPLSRLMAVAFIGYNS